MGFRSLISILESISRRLPYADQPVRPCSYEAMAGSRIAIDANHCLHRWRDRRSASAIADGIVAWARYMISMDIEPIFVFDAADRSAPRPAAATRSRRPPQAKAYRPGPGRRAADWKQPEADLVGLSRPRSAANSGVWSLARRALDREHVAWIRATHDADSLCAVLARDPLRLVDAVASDDTDLVALGADRVIRGGAAQLMSMESGPGRIYEIRLDNVRRALHQLTQDQLIQFCFALGRNQPTAGQQRPHHGSITADQALQLAAQIKSGSYRPSAQQSAAISDYMGLMDCHDPVLLDPGQDHAPISLLQWAELYRVKRAYARIDRKASGRRSR